MYLLINLLLILLFQPCFLFSSSSVYRQRNVSVTCQTRSKCYAAVKPTIPTPQNKTPALLKTVAAVNIILPTAGNFVLNRLDLLAHLSLSPFARFQPPRIIYGYELKFQVVGPTTR